MNIASSILGLTAETAIHAGASSANHVIDLPIMREHNTGWPVVYGSAVKGAMRAKAESIMEKSQVFTLFGPDTNNAADHAGSLLIGDARLLLLPVRSLTSQYRYVTCPDLLQRWQRDLERAGASLTELKLPSITGQTALVAQTTKDLFLEEYVFQCQKHDLTQLVSALASLADRSQQEISDKLTLVSNDQFALLCQAAIPVNARISIDNEHKTVMLGALWYEESLPAETVLYCLVSAQKSRSEKKQSASELMEAFASELFATPYLQLGGNETVGMGWCKVQVQQGAK